MARVAGVDARIHLHAEEKKGKERAQLQVEQPEADNPNHPPPPPTQTVAASRIRREDSFNPSVETASEAGGSRPGAKGAKIKEEMASFSGSRFGLNRGPRRKLPAPGRGGVGWRGGRR